jgi:hypothetical protein
MGSEVGSSGELGDRGLESSNISTASTSGAGSVLASRQSVAVRNTPCASEAVTQSGTRRLSVTSRPNPLEVAGLRGAREFMLAGLVTPSCESVRSRNWVHVQPRSRNGLRKTATQPAPPRCAQCCEGTLRERQPGHWRERAVTRLSPIPWTCASFVPETPDLAPRFPSCCSMVRRGSPVRVRKRAL